jgi:hypothetical protein
MASILHALWNRLPGGGRHRRKPARYVPVLQGLEERRLLSTFHEYAVPDPGHGVALTGITAGPDGNVWFTNTHPDFGGGVRSGTSRPTAPSPHSHSLRTSLPSGSSPVRTAAYGTAVLSTPSTRWGSGASRRTGPRPCSRFPTSEAWTKASDLSPSVPTATSGTARTRMFRETGRSGASHRAVKQRAP